MLESGLRYRGRLLTNGLLSRGYLGARLVSAVEGFSERRRDLVGPCSVAVSGLCSDSLASDEAWLGFQVPEFHFH